MASLNPLPSDEVVGSLSISLSIIVSLFFSGTVSREKLLGIHEMLLSLPLDPLPEYDLLYPNLTVRDNLKRYASLKAAYDEKELRELLEFFELLEYADKKASSLSSGTQRRVAMARAFLRSPEVLILDEPTRGLDPEWRLKFKRFLESAVLFSTHILSNVDELCEKITVIKESRVLFSGSLKEFKRGFPTGTSISLKVGGDIKMAAEVLEDNGYYPKNHERVYPAGKCRAVGNQHAPRERGYNR